jgi:hypothetical protein
MLCAASSFWWAAAAGFNAPVEIAGMLAGILVWIVFFAGFSVWHRESGMRGPERLVPALKLAAWIKFLFTAGGWGVFAACSLFKNEATILDAGLVFMMPDCLLGLAATGIVSLISGAPHLEKLDSFGWTALTTVVDGALFALVIGVIALAVLAWWRFGPGLLAKLNLSPARSAG